MQLTGFKLKIDLLGLFVSHLSENGNAPNVILGSPGFCGELFAAFSGASEYCQ
jgi:hypothetical protein